MIFEQQSKLNYRQKSILNNEIKLINKIQTKHVTTHEYNKYSCSSEILQPLTRVDFILRDD